MELFSHVRLQGGPSPVRRFLPDLIDRIWTRQIDPGKVSTPWRRADAAARSGSRAAIAVTSTPSVRRAGAISALR
jgi:hypothetical protein